MTTQLAFDITPKAPLQSVPVILNECPVRDRCLASILEQNDRYKCGFEQAGSVNACPKRKRMED